MRRRVERTLRTLTSKPAPHDGKELIHLYAQQHLSRLAPGSAGRRRNLQDVTRFLTFAVEECDAPLQWAPLKGQKRRALVGTASRLAILDQVISRSTKENQHSNAVGALKLQCQLTRLLEGG